MLLPVDDAIVGSSKLYWRYHFTKNALPVSRLHNKLQNYDAKQTLKL